MLAVGYDFFLARNAHVDPDAELASLMVMQTFLFNGNPTTGDPRVKLFEFRRLLANVCLDCIRVVNIVKRNLNRGFHHIVPVAD
jgi:hypothetical protein